MFELVTSDLDKDFGTESLETIRIESLPCTLRQCIHRPHIQCTDLGGTEGTNSSVREQRPSMPLLIRHLGGEEGELVRGDAVDVFEFGPGGSVDTFKEGLGDLFRLLRRQVTFQSSETVPDAGQSWPQD